MIDIARVEELQVLYDNSPSKQDWHVAHDLRPDILTATSSEGAGFLDAGHIATFAKYDQNGLDAELICALHNTAPELLDAVRRLMAIRDVWNDAEREFYFCSKSDGSWCDFCGDTLEDHQCLLRKLEDAINGKG